MKALTLWQPWASLVISGAKPYEFRRWDYRARAPHLVGQRIVIHAGTRPVRAAELADLIHRLGHDAGPFDKSSGGTGLVVGLALDLLERWWRQGKGAALPLAAGLGTVILGPPRQASVLFAGDVADSDRLDEHVWAWPVGAIEHFEPIVPAKGWRGFWNWHAPAKDAAE